MSSDLEWRDGQGGPQEDPDLFCSRKWGEEERETGVRQNQAQSRQREDEYCW